jgi:hypothetical protein
MNNRFFTSAIYPHVSLFLSQTQGDLSLKALTASVLVSSSATSTAPQCRPDICRNIFAACPCSAA